MSWHLPCCYIVMSCLRWSQYTSPHTGTCFIQKIYAPSSSLLQGKHLPFTPSPLRLNIFSLFVILSLTQLYCYTPEIFLFSTATFKYKYRAPLKRIGQEYSAKVAFSIFQSLKRIQLTPWSFLGHVSYCHHFSSVVCRPSVNISHFSLLLRNHWANCNQTLVEWSLDGSLLKMCPVITTSNQDGRQAKNRKRGGGEILIVHFCFSISQNELKS